MLNKTLLCIPFLLFLIFLSCTTKPSPIAPGLTKAPEAVATTAAEERWQTEWEKVQKEARKEGKLVLFTVLGGELRQAFSEAMKEYGVTLDVITGRSVELEERIFRERRAGIHNADLVIAGISVLSNIVKSAGQPMEPLLILPEVKDPKIWYKGKLNFLDKEGRALAFRAFLDTGIHYNTDIVKPGDINSMQDLLSPKWKGKIILNDPAIDGRGHFFLKVAILRLGDEYVKQLANQEPLLTRDLRQLVDWMAKGRYPIAIGVLPDQYQEYKRAGAPVDNLPLKEVSYLLSGLGNVGYLDKAPHPNAAKVFVNWLLSRKGQKVWEDIRVDQSARTDMPVDNLIRLGFLVREEVFDYYDSRSDAFYNMVDERSKFILSTFAALRR